MRVGLFCGLTLSAAIYAKCVLFDCVPVGVALTISLTIICAVFFSKLIASMLVLLVTRIHLDPAVVASPMLTTIIDALSLTIYFTIATTVLHIAIR